MTETRAPISPGEKFPVGYGNKKLVEVVALAGAKLGILLRLGREIEAATERGDSEALIELCPKALAVCLGGDDVMAAELWDSSVDPEATGEIVRATIGKTRLSEDDKKKLE